MISKKVGDRVKDLLENYPHLRDNDNKLVATIWKEDIIHAGFKAKSITALHFLHIFADGNLTSSSAIRRVRRKLQEELPELRGKIYNKRHKLEGEVRQEIIDFRNIMKGTHDSGNYQEYYDNCTRIEEGLDHKGS
tara:strand:+ start:1784 stop:2188 length:405 start_codon:yes stop_codon:yes gene_type:complete